MAHEEQAMRTKNVDDLAMIAAGVMKILSARWRRLSEVQALSGAGQQPLNGY